ncbi:MAG: choice-of-anchor V domain-containing protein [Phycisphaerae bacterium]
MRHWINSHWVNSHWINLLHTHQSGHGSIDTCRRDGAGYGLLRLAVMALVCFTSLDAFGFPAGPPPGFSGGPEGFGASCTSCHSFVQGPGQVLIEGAPRRYRPGATYDLTITIADPTQSAAGFQISAESTLSGFYGEFILSDTQETQWSFGSPSYISQTKDGYNASIANWAADGNQYSFNVQWLAPNFEQDATFFAAGNAVNQGSGSQGDHYYFGYASTTVAREFDADGDGDVDLRDIRDAFNCQTSDETAGEALCGYFDYDLDETVSLYDVLTSFQFMDGPTATVPAAYALADPVRGGRLYDKWWKVNGAPEPQGNHPLYPPFPFQSGSTTHRCKECHGWDYLGVDGDYGTGFHFTGIRGVRGTTKTPQELFRLLALGDDEIANGHDMLALGMTEVDLWDVIRFMLEGTIDTQSYIDQNDAFIGLQSNGVFTYQDSCSQCHGASGDQLPVGSPVFLGDLADENPWELMHKVRYGHP